VSPITNPPKIMLTILARVMNRSSLPVSEIVIGFYIQNLPGCMHKAEFNAKEDIDTVGVNKG